MISLESKGLYCESGGFYIDPSRGVDVALITHAHSDHARRGSRHYICARTSVSLLKHRLGDRISVQGVEYGQKFKLGEVWVSFHPAGHILGSAQIRVERGSEVWVASGDYKREPDPSCEPFEVVPCDTFITEATFGSPKYEWKTEAAKTAREILSWWQENRALGRNSILYAYALGKSQRILAELGALTDEPVHLFGEAAPVTDCYRAAGVRMVPTRRLEDLWTLAGESDAAFRARFMGQLVVAPHAISRTTWPERLGDPSTAFASGWMQTGAWGMHRQYERGFVMSDHADWPALIRTVQETGARRVLVLHGGEGALTKHLRRMGIHAAAIDDPQGWLF